ncbi:MAG TPA: hypothetical protein VF816_04760 [Rhodocyclaceae bacterium]
MRLVTNIVAAEEDEAEAVAMSDRPVDEWTGLEARDLDSAKLATLHCLLSDDDFEEALASYEPMFDTFDEDGALVVRIPETVAERLAVLEEEALEQVGEELAATEEFELDGWTVEDAQALLVGLGDLARLADSQGQVMYAWMVPLAS